MRFRAGRILAGVLVAAAAAVGSEEARTRHGGIFADEIRWSRTWYESGEVRCETWAVGSVAGGTFLSSISERRPPWRPRTLWSPSLEPGTRVRVTTGDPREDYMVENTAPLHVREALGFEVTTCPRAGGYGPARAFGLLLLPGWFVPTLLLAWPASRAARHLRRAAVERRRRARGLCLACGYDLVATPGRCPECGRPAAG